MTERPAGATVVCDVLVDAGIDLLVGLPGTQTVPLDREVAAREDVTYVMARHETAIPHVAWGYHETGGGVAATLTVPGPGDTNAAHGLKNALEDGVPLVHLSAAPDPDERGKGPIHELDPETFDHVVKRNVTVERPAELPAAVAGAVAAALEPPTGPVRLGIPSGFLAAGTDATPASVDPERTTFEHADAVARAAARLAAAERPVVYVGGGARRSPGGPAAVRALVDALDAPVVASLKGKGVVPDDHPAVLGTSASHLPAGARRVLDRSDVVLAVGADFDGVNTDHWTLPMGESLLHVTVDPRDVGRAYDADVAIPGDAATVCQELLAELPADAGGWSGTQLGRRVRAEYEDALRGRGLFGTDAPAKTPAIHRALRESIPDEVPVVTDIGGFRLWAAQVFPARSPETYVTAGSWAGMGVGLPGAVGAALADPSRPAVCLTGDGGLLMCLQELHTAVEYDLDVVTVVFDNADYGIITAATDRAVDFGWETTPDFAALARGFGCAATSVETPDEAGAAVADALERDGPSLIAVTVDGDEPSVVEAADYESTVDLG